MGTDLRPYLADNITPANYMDRMDDFYDVMLDLTGRAPCQGQKITLRDGGASNGWQNTNLGHPYINWPTNNIIAILGDINGRPNDWWFSGSTHELGHLFDEDAGNKWVFCSEALATYKAWLAIEKCGGVWFYGDTSSYEKPLKSMWDRYLTSHKNGDYDAYHGDNQNPLDYRSFLDGNWLIEWNKGDDIVYLLNSLFKDLDPSLVAYSAQALQKGWNILKKVFRSYYNGSYTPPYYPGRRQQYSVAGFLDICSHFISQDTGGSITNIKDLWLSETKTRYDENVTDRIDTTPWALLTPTSPRVGDALTFCVYNNQSPSSITVTLSLQRGSIWCPGFTSHTVTIPAGNGHAVAVGYTVQAADIGEGFILNLDGSGIDLWSTWTVPVRA